MTVLALEPVGGIAGDMLLAALLHLGAPSAALEEGLELLGEASDAVDLRGTRVVAAPAEVNGVRGLRVEVRVPAEVSRRRLLQYAHSIVTFAVLATSLQAFRSALMRSANSAGELLAASVASARSRCRTSGSGWPPGRWSGGSATSSARR